MKLRQLVLSGLDSVDRVPRDATNGGLPPGEGLGPTRIVVINGVWTDDDDVDVALRVVVAGSERPEQRDVHRRRIETPQALTQFIEKRTTQIGEREQGPRREVFAHQLHQNRRGHIAALHDSEFDESRHNPSGMPDSR